MVVGLVLVVPVYGDRGAVAPNNPTSSSPFFLGGATSTSTILEEDGSQKPTTTTTSTIAAAAAATKFPSRLYRMLQDAEVYNFEHVVSWVPGENNCFKVYDSKQFVKDILPNYFPRQSRYKSFLRQVCV